MKHFHLISEPTVILYKTLSYNEISQNTVGINGCKNNKQNWDSMEKYVFWEVPKKFGNYCSKV